jgi:2-polyprenyl-6-methoxyphenol hydroxylase-like FAD-dependent oxidoreductase
MAHFLVTCLLPPVQTQMLKGYSAQRHSVGRNSIIDSALFYWAEPIALRGVEVLLSSCIPVAFPDQWHRTNSLPVAGKGTVQPQVLIVGAGPVGMTAASELARFGIPLRIVDKSARRTDKSKALVMWSRTLELLNRGPGGAAPFIQAGFKALAVNIIARDAELMGRVNFDAVKSPYPYGLMLPQSETERLLEERLQVLGIAVEREVELLGFERREKAVEATLRHADGHEGTVLARWLLGCDGAHSVVRHTLATPFSGETFKSDWMLADVHMKGYPFPDSEPSIYWHKDGAFVIFPISTGRYRILADLPMSSAAEPAAPSLPQVQAIIDRRGPGKLISFDPIWLAGFRINGRKVADYGSGRVFLLGDAAHVHSPAGGQGMNTGMQDAFNLSWKLALVIRNLCGERLLNSYSAERSAVGDEVLKQASRLTAVGTIKNPVLQSLRNLVGHFMFGLSSVQHSFADSMTEVSIEYPSSPLNAYSASGYDAPKAGERAPIRENDLPVGAGDSPRFALYANDTTDSRALLSKYSSLLDSSLRVPYTDHGIWLVRPDGYVAFAGQRDALAEVDVYLANLGKLATDSAG